MTLEHLKFAVPRAVRLAITQYTTRLPVPRVGAIVACRPLSGAGAQANVAGRIVT